MLRLDRAMQELGIDTYATLIFAEITMSETGVPVMRWMNAGHPPPLLVQPEGITDLMPTTGPSTACSVSCPTANAKTTRRR